MTLLETCDLTLAIGGRTLCAGLDLKLHAGDNWAILGANGSGKTTLLHALSGLRHADRGQVLLGDRDIRQVHPRKLALARAVLLQEAEAGFAGNVMQTVLSGRHPHLRAWQWENAEDWRIASAALAAVDLSACGERALATLSGGERRRVEIAALIAQDAPICLLDEPTNHLDLHHQIRVLQLLTARTSRLKHANIMVLHDVNLATRFCSHGLFLMANGQHRHGRLDTVLDIGLLEQVYGCQFRQLGRNEDRVFLPA